jgi:hypothetical protein
VKCCASLLLCLLLFSIYPPPTHYCPSPSSRSSLLLTIEIILLPPPPSPFPTPPHTTYPSGPWFENWGRMVAVHPALSNEDRIQITKQLLKACDPNSKQGFIPNQVRYTVYCKQYSPFLSTCFHENENVSSDKITI